MTWEGEEQSRLNGEVRLGEREMLHHLCFSLENRAILCRLPAIPGLPTETRGGIFDQGAEPSLILQYIVPLV